MAAGPGEASTAATPSTAPAAFSAADTAAALAGEDRPTSAT